MKKNVFEFILVVMAAALTSLTLVTQPASAAPAGNPRDKCSPSLYQMCVL
ncbi:hypothetical protein ACIA49_33105 [Kribbella sp. NPDC051587]